MPHYMEESWQLLHRKLDTIKAFQSLPSKIFWLNFWRLHLYIVYTFSCLVSSSCDRKYISQASHSSTSQPCSNTVSSSTISEKQGRCVASDEVADCWSADRLATFEWRFLSWRWRFASRPKALPHTLHWNILLSSQPLSTTLEVQLTTGLVPALLL